MRHLDDHLARVEMRIGEHLARVEAGAAWHARRRQDLHDVVLRALPRQALHEAVDLLATLPAGRGSLVARIADQIIAAHGTEKRMPHLLLDVDEDVVVGPAGMAAVRRARRGGAQLIAGARRRLAMPLMVP